MFGETDNRRGQREAARLAGLLAEHFPDKLSYRFVAAPHQLPLLSRDRYYGWHGRKFHRPGGYASLVCPSAFR